MAVSGSRITQAKSPNSLRSPFPSGEKLPDRHSCLALLWLPSCGSARPGHSRRRFRNHCDSFVPSVRDKYAGYPVRVNKRRATVRFMFHCYPVRVNKKRATVRFMFHHPDDIRWFRPVELYTRGGRRGRITEPLGTHGGMKTLWDGPVVQQDAACMALYKRAFPKWPEDLSFTQ
eukprot:gene12398-15589_t